MVPLRYLRSLLITSSYRGRYTRALLAATSLMLFLPCVPADAHYRILARGHHSSQPQASATVKRSTERDLISPIVLDALQVAQKEAQADPSLLLAIAYKESSFDPKARNRLSSARGLLQFTETTWLEMVRDFGPQHGLSVYAAALNTDRDGRITSHSPQMWAAILRLRDKPRLSAIMAAERIRWKGRTLAAQLGRDLSAADLYVLYLLGPDGAYRFLAALELNPTASSVGIIGASARPNAGLFIHAGHAQTVIQAYADIQDMIREQQVRYANQLAGLTPTEIAEEP